jgi:hypothetical protein
MSNWTFEGMSLYDITGDENMTAQDITPQELAEIMYDYAYQYEYNEAYENGDDTTEATDSLDHVNFNNLAVKFLGA